MNILRVHATFQTELKYYEHYLAELFQSKNVSTTFLTTDKIEKDHKPFLKNAEVYAGEYNYNGSKLIRLKAIEFFGKQFIIELKKLYSIVTKTDYEILHLYGFGNPIGFLTIFLTLFKKKRVIIVASDHSDPNKVKSGLFARVYFVINLLLFKSLGRKIRRIYVPNRAGQKLIRKRYKISNSDLVKVVPLGFDPEIFNYVPSKKNNNDKLIIGFAGKIVENKRIEFLISALSKWDNQIYELIVVGMNKGNLSDYQKGLIAYANENQVNATFLPLKKGDFELADFYNYIDVAVFPGTISITTIEANGCGAPILLYNSIEGLEDRVEDDRGELFSTEDDLLKLLYVFRLKKENSAIDNSKIQIQTKKYSFGEIGELYLNDYKELMKFENDE